MHELTGRRVVANYETGYLFRIEYVDDDTLRWTSLKERTDGAPMTGTEKYSALKIREGLYSINWIEETGLVVSQTADFTNGKVYAFMTWNDETARGGRGALLHKGTLNIEK